MEALLRCLAITEALVAVAASVPQLAPAVLAYLAKAITEALEVAAVEALGRLARMVEREAPEETA